MPDTINFIEDVGGEERVVERKISTTGFILKIDGKKYSPTITTSVEIENSGENTTTMDQCGHTERERTGNKGWLIRVQGIVTSNDSRTGNLSLQMLRDVVATANKVKVRSDVISGSYTVSNVVITQSNDLVSVETRDTEGEEKAFEFQLQLGEKESA